MYETFGPTSQPLYQVKFDSTFPLDFERVKIGREVFHVPMKSRFVFVSQIKAFKGSDASNVHDKEPADDELEFSDDEAEAAYRSRLKRKCGTFLLFSSFSLPNLHVSLTAETRTMRMVPTTRTLILLLGLHDHRLSHTTTLMETITMRL